MARAALVLAVRSMRARTISMPITQMVYTTILLIIRTWTTTRWEMTSISKCKPTTSILPPFLLFLPVAGRRCSMWILRPISTCPGTVILKCPARIMPTPSLAHMTAKRSIRNMAVLTSIARRTSPQPPYRPEAWSLDALTSSSCISATGRLPA